MPYMQPQLYFGTMFEPEHEEDDLRTVDDITTKEIESGRLVSAGTGWFVRLSASGFLDRTDWHGPHTDDASARQYLEDTYDVCGYCGESLDLDDSPTCCDRASDP